MFGVSYSRNELFYFENKITASRYIPGVTNVPSSVFVLAYVSVRSPKKY